MRIVLLLGLLPCCATASPALSGAQEVRFRAMHDPNIIALADGTRLSVLYGAGDWEKTRAWREDKTLVLGFDPERGTVLADPEGTLALPVVDDLGDRHPIAVADQLCQEANPTTVGIGDCLATAMARWNRRSGAWPPPPPPSPSCASWRSVSASSLRIEGIFRRHDRREASIPDDEKKQFFTQVRGRPPGSSESEPPRLSRRLRTSTALEHERIGEVRTRGA